MKPEQANLYTVTATGRPRDFELSFYYEWRDTNDGKSMDTSKQKVASVVMDIGDMLGLCDTLTKIRNLDNAPRPKPGGWEGKISMSDDFDHPIDEFEEYM